MHCVREAKQNVMQRTDITRTTAAITTSTPWPHPTYTSIPNGNVGRILGAGDKDLNDTAVDEVHLITGGVLSHNDLVVEGNGRLDGVGHLFCKVFVGHRFKDWNLVGDVSSVELLDFPPQYRRYHVEDFGLIVELAIGVLQVEVILDLFSHGGRKLLAAHVIVNDREFILELSRR